MAYIRHALQNWGPWDELPLYDSESSKISFRTEFAPFLKQVLWRAKNLSEDFCETSRPLTTFLRHAQASEALVDDLEEIQWCTLVGYYSDEGRRSIGEL